MELVPCVKLVKPISMSGSSEVWQAVVDGKPKVAKRSPNTAAACYRNMTFIPLNAGAIRTSSQAYQFMNDGRGLLLMDMADESLENGTFDYKTKVRAV